MQRDPYLQQIAGHVVTESPFSKSLRLSDCSMKSAMSERPLFFNNVPPQHIFVAKSPLPSMPNLLNKHTNENR